MPATSLVALVVPLVVTLLAGEASSMTRARAPSTARPTSVLVAQARGQKPRSPQEERRRKLLEEMGLRKQDQPAPSPAPTPTPGSPSPSSPDDGAAPTPAPGSDKAGKSHGQRPAVSAPGPSFRRGIHPLFLQACKTCHAPGGPAAMTSFLLSGDAVPDHAAVARLVDRRAPASSTLLAKASGQKPHAGAAPWPVGSASYGRVLAWVQAGARLDGASPTPSSPADVPETAIARRPPRAPSPLPTAKPAGTPGTPGHQADGVPEPGASVPPGSTTATGLPSTPEADAASEVDGAGKGAAVATGAPEAATIDFATDVHPTLVHTCAACHSPLGPAASTRLILSGEVDNDYAKVRALVNPKAPAQSLLLTKSAGEGHAGGVLFAAGSTKYLLLLNWVTAGATRLSDAIEIVVGPSTASSGGTGAPPPPAAPTATAATPPPPAPRPVEGGLALPGGIALNGRFDLAYERRGFSGDPTDGAATDALRSHHHFLFLTRESTSDPIGLAIELLSLQFWEAHARFRGKRMPIEVVVAAGKLLVPFGAEPLMHQSYGGLAGFDQRILPAIWAQHGLVVRAVAHRCELAITEDIYVVRGYGLRQADAVINLQNDFSSEDDAHLGWGNRLGAAWGPLSGWYSTYYNRLGFGRRLVMQAADVMLWRIRKVPVLGHFSFAAGLMRADVSGGDDAGTGGPGRDYYHFGSYFQLRYHPTDWLYLQYRQGLRTFNNRRGVILDGTRLTSDDGSAHNFGVVARYRGLTGGLFYFINLEKVDEIPDDFLRLSLTYDF